MHSLYLDPGDLALRYPHGRDTRHPYALRWSPLSSVTSTISLGWCNREMDLGSMIHEIGHNMGLGHEHKRPDRDKYIRVTSGGSQFSIDASADQSRPYSYQSIMHYGTGIQTPAGIRTGRRTGGYNGNDISQVRRRVGMQSHRRTKQLNASASTHSTCATRFTSALELRSNRDVFQIRHIYECEPYTHSARAVLIAYEHVCTGAWLHRGRPLQHAKAF